MKLELKEIMENWKKEIEFYKYERETIAVHSCGDVLFVITKRPGLFIGKYGTLVDKYRNILRENGYPDQVIFVDLFCGGVRIF